MAANSKIFVRRLFVPKPSSSSFSHGFFSSGFRLRVSHWSSYEKNPEDQIEPTVVPDHMIHSLSENYWAPDPQTGVFGPSTAHQASVPNDISAGGSLPKEGSVLDLKAWFRHSGLEDSEKPL